MSIGAVCIREVVSATRTASIAEVADLMRHSHVGCVVIVEDMADRQVPVGIITDRDIIVQVVAMGLDPKVLLAEDVMTPSPITVEEGEELEDVVQMMCLRGIRRAPVMDGSGSLSGIVSVNDLVVTLANDLNVLARLSARQRDREVVMHR